MLDAGGKLSSGVIPSIALSSVQVVVNQAARLALSNVEPGDCAKQSDNGLTYMLSSLPASIDSNWITSGDTTIDAADIVAGFISPARLGTGSASATTALMGSQQYVPLGPWAFAINQVVSANTAMTQNTIYDANGSTQITLTLPTVASVGSILQVCGLGAGGWRIAQGAGQQIVFGKFSTTSGTAGYLASTDSNNVVTLKCRSANIAWQVTSSVGVLDIA